MRFMAKFGSDITLLDCIREAPVFYLSQDIKYPDVFHVFSSGSPDGLLKFSLNYAQNTKFHNIANSSSTIHYARELGHSSWYSAKGRAGVRIPADTTHYFLLRIFQTFRL
jgi:hypothetical protein